MVSENILFFPSIPSSLLTAEHVLYFACSGLIGSMYMYQKTSKAGLGSASAGERNCAEPSHSQNAEEKELGSKELHGASLVGTPAGTSEKIWKPCPQTCMRDGTKAELGNYTIPIHTDKNSSNQKQWLFLLQIRFNLLHP